MIGPVSKALAPLTMRPALTPRLEVTRLDVAIPGLPPGLEGVRLAHVSDLHVGDSPWEPMRVAEASKVIDFEGPDLVVNTGDYFQGEPDLGRVLARVRMLLRANSSGSRAPLNLTVLGNHDYYAGEERTRALAAALTSAGLRVLHNEVVIVPVRRGEITIVGLDAQQEGLDEAFDALPDAPRPRIVLIHAPDLAQRIPAGAAELILAGHTHGGQIRIPFLSGPIVRRFSGSEYSQQRYRVNGMPMYINRGLGCTGVPVRFRARPEVSLIRLLGG